MTSASITVCALDVMEHMLVKTNATHLISLINPQMMPQTPDFLRAEDHLKLSMNDVEAPIDGYVTPSVQHIEKLVVFAREWDRSSPMVVHCWAGISRSTAAAFITLCALNPEASEEKIAKLIRENSPTATPNGLLVSCADQYLERSGRMIEAIHDIGRGDVASAGDPFTLPVLFEDRGS